MPAAAFLELLARAAGAGLVPSGFGHGSSVRRRALPRSPPAPVIGDGDDTARQGLACFSHDPILILRVEAEQGLAMLVAAEREDREEEQRVSLRVEQRLPGFRAEADTLHEAFRPIRRDHDVVRRDPQDRLEVSVRGVAEDRVVSAHDPADYGFRFAVTRGDRLFAPPDRWGTLPRR